MHTLGRIDPTKWLYFNLRFTRRARSTKELGFPNLPLLSGSATLVTIVGGLALQNFERYNSCTACGTHYLAQDHTGERTFYVARTELEESAEQVAQFGSLVEGVPGGGVE